MHLVHWDLHRGDASVCDNGALGQGVPESVQAFPLKRVGLLLCTKDVPVSHARKEAGMTFKRPQLPDQSLPCRIEAMFFGGYKVIFAVEHTCIF